MPGKTCMRRQCVEVGCGLQTMYTSLLKKDFFKKDSLEVTLTFTAPAGSNTANAPLIPYYPVTGVLTLTDADQVVLGASKVQCAQSPCTHGLSIGADLQAAFQQAKDSLLKVPLTLSFVPDATVTPPAGVTFPATALAPVTSVSISL